MPFWAQPGFWHPAQPPLWHVLGAGRPGMPWGDFDPTMPLPMPSIDDLAPDPDANGLPGGGFPSITMSGTEVADMLYAKYDAVEFAVTGQHTMRCSVKPKPGGKVTTYRDSQIIAAPDDIAVYSWGDDEGYHNVEAPMGSSLETNHDLKRGFFSFQTRYKESTGMLGPDTDLYAHFGFQKLSAYWDMATLTYDIIQDALMIYGVGKAAFYGLGNLGRLPRPYIGRGRNPG